MGHIAENAMHAPPVESRLGCRFHLIPKTFTVDRSILPYVQNTRQGRSRSERVNELLRRAIIQEQYERLAEEAAEFFSFKSKAERAEAKAFQSASIKSITRD